MNIWTQKSIELANQRNYLDLLYQVYPISPNLKREIGEDDFNLIQKYHNDRNPEILSILLRQEIFPIKDSYVAYLKHDNSAILRNPNTINRLLGLIYQMSFDKIIDNITAPKETNRQIGPMFKSWVNNFLAYPKTNNVDEFLSYQNGTIIFNSSDENMKNLAITYFGYNRPDKGLDFIAKNGNNIYLSEAKFLTDFGGHQNGQFTDAITTMQTPLLPNDFVVKTIAILDGVLYIPNNGKMYRVLSSFADDEVVISAILLNDFLCTI